MSIPSMLSLGTGRQIMTVALPFDPSDPSPGWNVRLPDTTDADATHLFGELDVYLRGSAAFYSHPWAPGDLMIIDNWQVLHGRSAITGNGPRHLYRGQLQ
jgi:alpha-ketoglutarate-dependent taurine dioxygenase